MSFWRKPNFVSSSIKFYDFLVNDLNCRYAWRCHKDNIFKNYQKNLKTDHLEIGPGSGYFLKPEFHQKKINKLFLMDINQPILEASKQNLNKYFTNIQTLNFNIFDKPMNSLKIDSVGINYVLHCVPGSLDQKLEKLYLNLPKNTNIFGATVISDIDRQTPLSKLELKLLNYKGVFNNDLDFSNNFLDFVSKNRLPYSYKIIGNVLIFQFINKKV